MAYPLALVTMGYAWGGLAMTLLSVGLNLLVVRAYDWARTDFLLIETLKGLRDAPAGSRWRRLAGRVLCRGDALAFVLLSWIEDPVVVTLYLRQGSHRYDGFARRDWGIFAASTAVSNLAWIASVGSAIEILALLRRLLA